MHRYHQRILILVLCFGLFGGHACAQLPWGHPGANSGPLVCGGFVGAGDLGIAGIDAWYSLRAFTASSCGTKLIRVEKGLIGVAGQQDFGSVSSTGKLDIGAINTFAGTDATCTATISGTTMTVSSCAAGTLHVWDTITGAGIVQPSLISDAGSCGSPPGTCTLNAAQTVSSPETITAQTSLVIVTFYDQSGANFCVGAIPCNAPAGHLDGIVLVPDCGNTLPCIYYQFNRPSVPETPSATWPNPPYTMSVVSARADRFSSKSYIQGWNNATSNGALYPASTNTVELFQTNQPTATASDGNLHAFQFVINASSSFINVDGTANAVNVGANINPGTTTLRIGASGFGEVSAALYINEFGFWTGALSGPNQTALCHNEHHYWGTATPC